MLQWSIYDAYITDQEKQRAQEEANKQKAAAKKASANAETAESSQDPVKACLPLPDLHAEANHCALFLTSKALQAIESQCYSPTQDTLGMSYALHKLPSSTHMYFSSGCYVADYKVGPDERFTMY